MMLAITTWKECALFGLLEGQDQVACIFRWLLPVLPSSQDPGNRARGPRRIPAESKVEGIFEQLQNPNPTTPNHHLRTSFPRT